MNLYVDAREMCAILKISRATLHRYMQDGLPYIKLGHGIRFSVKDLKKYMDTKRIIRSPATT